MRTFRGDDLIAIGLTPGPVFGDALRLLPKAAKRLGREGALNHLRVVVADPATHVDDPYFAPLAQRLVGDAKVEAAKFVERDEPASYANFCMDAEGGALNQMNNSMRLPSAARGALMPDAHQGYGLPIGGVLATRGTVIPFGVGVDIGCRLHLSVLDIDLKVLEGQADRVRKALLNETIFGAGKDRPIEQRPDSALFEDERWSNDPVAQRLRDTAWRQVGTSGSGNHFVDIGILTLDQDDLGLRAGSYVAIMSHSGSRGAGAKIADHYSKLAESLHPELPAELKHLAWLDLDSDEGRGYFDAMNLMGDYAALCHEVIHERLAKALGAQQLKVIQNHHNFAWLEEHDGELLTVHRKGATPAGQGVLGVIPGSMASPAYVVRGRGESTSLRSASHGAGRLMSRTQARNSFTQSQMNALLEQAGVTLLSGGLDESPFAYKDINDVMSAQQELVDVVAQFKPKLVRMADDRDDNFPKRKRRK